MTEPDPIDPTPEPDALWDVCPACYAVVAGITRHLGAAHPEPAEPAPEPEPTDPDDETEPDPEPDPAPTEPTEEP